MSTIDTSTTTTTPAAGINTINTGPGESAALSGLDKDAFLKLLVAQLRYQNPMSPLDGQEYLAQAAQFATVERLEGLAKAQAEMVAYQKVSIAASFVGRHVRGIDELGQTVEGTVRSVKFSGGAAVLDVDGSNVMLETVEEVTPGAAPAPAPAPAAAAAPAAAPTPDPDPTEAMDGRTDSTQEAATP
jgi:flagellar basal-body rod modification protein FlgD